jgi:hypothetical protein
MPQRIRDAAVPAQVAAAANDRNLVFFFVASCD